MDTYFDIENMNIDKDTNCVNLKVLVNITDIGITAIHPITEKANSTVECTDVPLCS